MKKLIFVFGILCSICSFAQVSNESNEPIIKCDVIKTNSDKNILEFNKNVHFKTDIVEIENAEKIVFNRTTKEVVATGLNNFVIDGAIQIKDKAEGKTLRYTISDRIAYIE